MDSQDTGSNKGQKRSQQFEKVSMDKLIKLSRVAIRQEKITVDPEALHHAINLMFLSLKKGSKIEVLYDVDNQFYPATVTKKSRTEMHFTYDDTDEKEHGIVKCDKFSTEWRFPAITKKQRWLCKAVETHLM